ncbi:MAG: TIGR03757 family integrating conjugative element protein [Candidatus Thiodiazotropha sp.]
MEVFTTTDWEVQWESEAGANEASKKIHGLDITLYEIDGIASIERDLSIGMPADSEKSKRIALERIQHMDDQSKTKMQMAAKGLAKAMQYGVDRYPAIVFDGQAVVYGVSDVQTALAHYRAWRREGKR